MHKSLITLALLSASAASTFAQENVKIIPPEAPEQLKPAERPLVQIAILLDTSSSMDGLINQARTQLWTIVNEINKTKRNGQTPRLEVALFEYGNARLAAGEGYIRMVQPLGGNLDDLSEKLFALTTNGGDEFCGQVIGQATATLNWSSDPNVYKAIFIAGNEPFGQGSIDYKSTIASALGRGIVVNTIHCGSRGDGLSGEWAAGAKLGEGMFANIDQNRVIHVRRAPQDDRIEALSVQINVTYVPYGKKGERARENQMLQDGNAMKNKEAGSSVQRAAAKAGGNYDNAGWDLIDADAQGKIDLATVDPTLLPEAMRTMSVQERKDFIAKLAKDRDAIRVEIAKLMVEREAFLAQQPKTDDEAQFDSALVESLRVQLKAKKFD